LFPDQEVIWTLENIGNGFVSPVFTEEHFFITGETDSVLILYCFNLNGEREWQSVLEREWVKSCPGSRSAPTIVDNLIYVGTGMGSLFCIKRDDGSIYYAAGDGSCGVKLNLSEDGTEIKEVWRNKDFDSFMGGILKIGDYLYGCGTVKPDLRIIDAFSGKITDSLRIGSGALITADEMLYYYTQRSDMMLFSYNRGKIKKISSNEPPRCKQTGYLKGINS